MALLGLLIVVAAVQMMQINNLNDKITARATVLAASAASPPADDAYAKMMLEHHGIDVNAGKTQDKSASALDNVPNMIGGC